MESVRAGIVIAAWMQLAGALLAQERPQFVWSGEVDGIDVLYIRGNRLEVKVQEGGPVQRQQFHFYDPLPDTNQNARLEVHQGRGLVQIIDQPRLDNQYTLAISIEDRQPGSSFYSIAVYWDTSNQRFERSRSSERTDTLSWSGRVDEEAIITCHDKSCTSTAPHGAAVADERIRFSRPLPNSDVDVRLEEREGRGDIRVIEQPRERNHYTARISISDPMAGADDYSFVLVWKRPSGKEPEPERTAERGLIWTGAVDGRARVTVQGGTSFSEVIAGGPISGEHADFLRPLPASADVTPTVRKIRGRGKVAIVESPSEKNHYRLVFEIDDPGPGLDGYEVEIDW